jgi:hypothetical protein
LRNFQELKNVNTHISFNHVEDPKFKQYGRVLPDVDFEEILGYMKDSEIPQHENIYVPSVAQMEGTTLKEVIQTHIYGDMPIQIGYCNGRNSHLNGLEYHKGSEVNIAVTDFVLFLGRVQDIENNCYTSDNVDAFFIPEGTVVELYGTTLHFAPCKVTDEGFKAVVILPEGTNQPLDVHVEKRTAEDELLFMKNKWLLAHPERKPLMERGAYPGIKGENIEVNY